MVNKLVYITRNITFNDLRLGKKSTVDVYEEFMNSCLFNPLEQLSQSKQKSFEYGYAMLGLELLFFEPHGKYLLGNTKRGSKFSFDFGLKEFLKYLRNKNLIDNNILVRFNETNFYSISRCGIFHNMAIDSGLLIDSIHMENSKVFYKSPIKNGILVSPWNFLTAQKDYFNNYIKSLKNDDKSDIYKNFETTFKQFFKY